MTQLHPSIPQHIYDDLTEEARRFFFALITKLEGKISQVSLVSTLTNTSLPPSA
ncbi:MAG: hypothetical protein WCK15_24275 [Pirellula sp.]